MKFNAQLQIARRNSQSTVDRFFRQCQDHTVAGRSILKDLKYAAHMISCDSPHDEIRDLFLQGYDMVTSIMSEVRFFEIKLDEYAPAVPMSKISDIRSYSVL